MTWTDSDKRDIQKHGFLQAVNRVGSQAALAALVGISGKRINHYINRGDQPNLAVCLIIEEETGVSIERLSPYTERANHIVRQKMGAVKPLLPSQSLPPIIIDESLSQLGASSHPHRPVIIDTQGILIVGYGRQPSAHCHPNTHPMAPLILDLDALLLKMRTLSEFSDSLLISERGAIAIRLAAYLGHEQGQRTDLAPKERSKNHRGCHLFSHREKVPGRTEVIVAQIVGPWRKDTFYRVKQVLSHGCTELIDAMDNRELTISAAAKLTQNSNDLSHWQQQRRQQHAV